MFSDLSYKRYGFVWRKNSTVILENENLDVIKQIKISNSLNDKFFICFSNDKNPICIINDNP